MLQLAAGNDPVKASDFRQRVGAGVKVALQQQFSKYNLLGKNWADLTQSTQPAGQGSGEVQFVDETGSGFLNRGAARYQILVPSYTVMFAFTLLLPVGWLFVMERRQGTLRRLRAIGLPLWLVVFFFAPVLNLLFFLLLSTLPSRAPKGTALPRGATTRDALACARG